MSIYQPYFYVIYFKALDKRYAGIRFARGCNPNELLIKYKTSSKVVHKLLQEGYSPIIEQITPFDDVDQLRNYEVAFLRPKIMDDRWLNKGAGKAIYNDDATKKLIGSYFKGRVLTPEHRAAISRGGKGRKDSPETIERKRLARKGKPNPEAAIRMKGHIKSEETCRRISVAKTGKPATEAQLIAIAKVAEINRGREKSEVERQKISENTTRQWARIREQKCGSLDLKAIAADLEDGMMKKDIYKKYDISRHYFKENIIPLL